MTLRLFIAFFILSGLSFSCKKGEEDPTISFKSRTARLKGEWKAQEANWVEIDSVAVLSNGQLTVTRNNQDLPPIDASYSYNFERQGNYRMTRRIVYPDNWGNTGRVGFTENYEETGLWQFTGGAGDSKTKSQLLLLPNKRQVSRFLGSALDIESFDGQYEGLVYDMVKLTSTEMILEYQRERSDDLGSYTSEASIKLVRP